MQYGKQVMVTLLFTEKLGEEIHFLMVSLEGFIEFVNKKEVDEYIA